MNLLETVSFFFFPNISLHSVCSEKDLIELSLCLMIHQQIYPELWDSGLPEENRNGGFNT